jgi:hypothetical protein
LDQNSIYIEGLIENLSPVLDKYIMSGSPKALERVFNILDQIAAQADDEELVRKAIRMTKRAGVPMQKKYTGKFEKELGKTDGSQRRTEAETRRQWEAQRTSTSETGSNIASNVEGGKSALTRRMSSNAKPDLFMNSFLDPGSIASIADETLEFQKEMEGGSSQFDNVNGVVADDSAAASRVSEFVARAGAGSSFDGESLGIGGLNDVLAQIKRRVWTPLAAPPQLLKELGIHPVRGLLLYGKPGCGKFSYFYSYFHS